MLFEELNLHPKILKAIKDAGYTTPTPIQAQAIPMVMAGRDLCASAQTGTGKTASFILPAMQRVMEPSALGKFNFSPRVLILVPTRELAIQVADEAIKYSTYLSKMKVVCIYGGAPYPVQNRQLSRPYEILVATPGRLMDHLSSKRLNFSQLEMFILDEADRMLDMGFIKDVEQIASSMPKERQTLLFSATLRGNVQKLTQQILNNPATISVTPDHAKHENIQQKFLFVKNIGDKYEHLDNILSDESINQAIIFTSTKRQTEELQEDLVSKGHLAGCLHGDMNQHQRTRTINRMRNNQIRILVATDVAARGIDVQTITHVINFDLPFNADDYVHRIGRTGRAQSKGIAITMASPRDRNMVKEIEKFTGQQILPPEMAKPKPQFKPRPNSQKPRGFTSKFGGAQKGPKPASKAFGKPKRSF